MTWLPQSPGSTLVFRLSQETVHRLRLAVLTTMRPALDSAGRRVPRTKPTCLLHTWRPHRQRPFTLALHQHQSSCNLHLQYLAKNQSTQRCQSLITPRSDHPPVLEPHMVLIRAHQDPTRKCGSSMTRSTRVALRDPNGVSTIPLTKPSLELRTISLRASTEPQYTKPSRRWQPTRVTSTPACNTNT
jgi:hypothetical protein